MGLDHIEKLENGGYLDDLDDDLIKIHHLKIKSCYGRSLKVGYAIAHKSNGYSGFQHGWSHGGEIAPRLAYIGNCCYGSRSEAKLALQQYKERGHWKSEDKCSQTMYQGITGDGWVSRRFNQEKGFGEDFTHFFEIIEFELDSQMWESDGCENDEFEEVDEEEIELYMSEFAAQDTDWDLGDKDYASDYLSEEEENSEDDDDEDFYNEYGPY